VFHFATHHAKILGVLNLIYVLVTLGTQKIQRVKQTVYQSVSPHAVMGYVQHQMYAAAILAL